MSNKQLWVLANGDAPWEKRKALVTTALESGADVVVVNGGETKKVKELGTIKVASPGENADIRLFNSLTELKGAKAKNRALLKTIENKSDEEEIAKASSAAFVIVSAANWKVIPLENLIAQLTGRTKIIMEVSSLDDAKLALGTLEIGADGIMVNDMKMIKKARETIDEVSNPDVSIEEAKVISIKPVGMGDRICVDTCSIFEKGEGMLLGSQGSSLFLVHSENVESPYVAARPFRVNAGPVHAYVLMPDGKTRYLSELASGDEVLAVNSKGKTRRLVVGRIKTEKRPMILVEAESKGRKLKTILQNAETIRLVGKNGKPLSVPSLMEGDEVLVHMEDTGRHFGVAVKESITEK